MARFLAVIMVLILQAGSAKAGHWADYRGQGWVWYEDNGRTDGILYQGFWEYNRWVYRPVQQVIMQQQVIQQGAPQQQIQQQPQVQQQPGQYDQQQSYQPDRSFIRMQMLAQMQQHKEDLEWVEKLGLSGARGQGIESPYGNQSLQMYSGQYGGAGRAIQQYAPDLPLQQGNTVYGSLDNTYNGQADPFRNYDVQALLNQYMSLAAQVEQGSSRVRSEVGATLNQTTEAYRLIKETELRGGAMLEVMKVMQQAMQANESKTFRFSQDERGIPKIQLLPDAPPGGPPPGPPGGAEPIDDLGAAAAGVGRPSQEEFVALTKLVGAKCLACHGGDKTGPEQKLHLGDGGTVSLVSISPTQFGKIGDRVANGTMPQGGTLSRPEKALFAKFFPAKGKK